MEDNQVRAELERIGIKRKLCQRSECEVCRGFRLLAESQQALREIGEHKPWLTPSKPPRMWPDGYPCKYCEEMIEIARNVKGGK